MVEKTQKTYLGWDARLIMKRARLHTMMNGSKRLVVIIPSRPGFTQEWDVEKFPDHIRLTQWLGSIAINITR